MHRGDDLEVEAHKYGLISYYTLILGHVLRSFLICTYAQLNTMDLRGKCISMNVNQSLSGQVFLRERTPIFKNIV